MVRKRKLLYVSSDKAVLQSISWGRVSSSISVQSVSYKRARGYVVRGQFTYVVQGLTGSRTIVWLPDDHHMLPG